MNEVCYVIENGIYFLHVYSLEEKFEIGRSVFIAYDDETYVIKRHGKKELVKKWHREMWKRCTESKALFFYEKIKVIECDYSVEEINKIINAHGDTYGYLKDFLEKKCQQRNKITQLIINTTKSY